MVPYILGNNVDVVIVLLLITREYRASVISGSGH